jgi:hypothetical protein
MNTQSLIDGERQMLNEYSLATKHYASVAMQFSNAVSTGDYETIDKLITLVDEADAACERIRTELVTFRSTEKASSTVP